MSPSFILEGWLSFSGSGKSVGQAFQIAVIFLHGLNGNTLSLDEEHHDDVREKEKRLFEERGHRLGGFHFFWSTEDLAGYPNAEVRQLAMVIFRVGGEQGNPRSGVLRQSDDVQLHISDGTVPDEEIARPDSRAGGIIDDVGWNSHVRQAHGECAHRKLHTPHRI